VQVRQRHPRSGCCNKFLLLPDLSESAFKRILKTHLFSTARRHWDVFMILAPDINIPTYIITYFRSNRNCWCKLDYKPPTSGILLLSNMASPAGILDFWLKWGLVIDRFLVRIIFYPCTKFSAKISYLDRIWPQMKSRTAAAILNLLQVYILVTRYLSGGLLHAVCRIWCKSGNTRPTYGIFLFSILRIRRFRFRLKWIYHSDDICNSVLLNLMPKLVPFISSWDAKIQIFITIASSFIRSRW